MLKDWAVEPRSYGACLHVVHDLSIQDAMHGGGKILCRFDYAGGALSAQEMGFFFCGCSAPGST